MGLQVRFFEIQTSFSYFFFDLQCCLYNGDEECYKFRSPDREMNSSILWRASRRLETDIPSKNPRISLKIASIFLIALNDSV